MDLTEAKIYARLVLDTHAATLEQAPSGYACKVARFVLDLPEPAEDSKAVTADPFDALAGAIVLAAGRTAHGDGTILAVRRALAADLRDAWPNLRPEPVSPAPGAESGRSGDLAEARLGFGPLATPAERVGARCGLPECRACDGPNGCKERDEPSDLFADGYSVGRYGTPFEPELIAAMHDHDVAEWTRGFFRGQDAAEMDSATDERFGDHGSPRGPVEG